MSHGRVTLNSLKVISASVMQQIGEKYFQRFEPDIPAVYLHSSKLSIQHISFPNRKKAKSTYSPSKSRLWRMVVPLKRALRESGERNSLVSQNYRRTFRTSGTTPGPLPETYYTKILYGEEKNVL